MIFVNITKSLRAEKTFISYWLDDDVVKVVAGGGTIMTSVDCDYAHAILAANRAAWQNASKKAANHQHKQ